MKEDVFLSSQSAKYLAYMKLVFVSFSYTRSSLPKQIVQRSSYFS